MQWVEFSAQQSANIRVEKPEIVPFLLSENSFFRDPHGRVLLYRQRYKFLLREQVNQSHQVLNLYCRTLW